MPDVKKILLRLKERLGVDSDRAIAEMLGIGEKALNARKSRGVSIEKELRALAQQRPELGLDVGYILTGEGLTGLRKAEAGLIAQLAATGRMPGASLAMASLEEEERRISARKDRLRTIERQLCSTLDDAEFAGAEQMLLDYVLCTPADRAAINRAATGLRALNEPARKKD